MPRYGRTTAPVMPLAEDVKPAKKESAKFKDKESQKELDKVRKQHSPDYAKNRGLDYNPKLDQMRVWSERSPQAYDIPYKSLGREKHLEHPQLKSPSSKKDGKGKRK